MPGLRIIRDADGIASDVEPDKLLHGEVVAVGRLAGGMASGKSSVAIRITLDDGRTVMAETSQALFITAANAIEGFDAYDRIQAQLAKPSGEPH